MEVLTLQEKGSKQHAAKHYEVRELQAPEGWKRSPERFPIALEPEGEEAGTVIRARVTVRNALIYTPVTLTKTDITGANTVPGALIEVRDENGAEYRLP